MKYVERDVPWGEICSFLNTLAKSENMTSRIWGDEFPEPSDGICRPLPEDFVLCGQLYCQTYFPKNWFQEAMIDDEKRALELPSMAAQRSERILWLGIRIASVRTITSSIRLNTANLVQFDRWIRFDREFHKFVIIKYEAELLSPSTLKRHNSLKALITPVDNAHDRRSARG